MFGERLKIIRNKHDLSQRELARLLNIGASTLGMYEINKRAPDYDTLLNIADFFNCTVDYLLGRTDDPTPPQATQGKEPDYDKEVLAAKSLGDASIVIARLYGEDKIDDDEFIRLSKKAYKHFGLPPVKGAEDAAHAEHNIPGTGVLNKDNNGENNS